MTAVNQPSRALTTVLEELKRRKPIFHRPEFGMTRADERTTVEDSGRLACAMPANAVVRAGLMPSQGRGDSYLCSRRADTFGRFRMMLCGLPLGRT